MRITPIEIEFPKSYVNVIVGFPGEIGTAFSRNDW